MYHSMKLSITGYLDAPAPHTFYRQDGETRHLAMLLPGLGYSCDMPLLYYPTGLLLAMGADVLRVEYDYRQSWANQDLPLEEKLARLYADVRGAARIALNQREYTSFTIIGKSLGTYAITCLLQADLPLRPHSCVYLTPLLLDAVGKSEVIRACPQKLFIIGTADRYYDPTSFAQVVEATGGDALLIDGGDHSLEFRGDPVRSVQALEKVIRGIQEFLT